jgi:hypothetical protein
MGDNMLGVSLTKVEFLPKHDRDELEKKIRLAKEFEKTKEYSLMRK